MFLRELNQRVNNGKPYPTLFAWHGSSLGNWHSIIRTGLDFSQTVNGRAYGNGVYFAKDFETSFSYSRHDGRLWRNSALEITSAITLCEIVNDTSRFVSTSPYFVVNLVDWTVPTSLHSSWHNVAVKQPNCECDTSKYTSNSLRRTGPYSPTKMRVAVGFDPSIRLVDVSTYA